MDSYRSSDGTTDRPSGGLNGTNNVLVEVTRQDGVAVRTGVTVESDESIPDERRYDHGFQPPIRRVGRDSDGELVDPVETDRMHDVRNCVGGVR